MSLSMILNSDVEISNFSGIWKLEIGISGNPNIQIPEKLEISKSEFKIMLSDINWVGKIPYTLILAQTSQFLEFPKIPIPNSQIPEISKCHQKLPKINVNML